MSNIQQGHCLCGHVQIQAQFTDQQFTVCHCHMCRRWGGGPFFAIPCGQNIHLMGQEHIQEYDSSPWAKRGFCRHCGTHLYYRVKKNNEYNVPLGLFDKPDDLTMTMQYFIDLKPDYYCFHQKTATLSSKEIEAYFADAMAEARQEQQEK